MTLLLCAIGMTYAGRDVCQTATNSEPGGNWGHVDTGRGPKAMVILTANFN